MVEPKSPWLLRWLENRYMTGPVFTVEVGEYSEGAAVSLFQYVFGDEISFIWHESSGVSSDLFFSYIIYIAGTYI